jgi:hypothetical protein
LHTVLSMLHLQSPALTTRGFFLAAAIVLAAALAEASVRNNRDFSCAAYEAAHARWSLHKH